MYTLVSPSYRCFISNLALIGQAVSENKMYEYYGHIDVSCPRVQAVSGKKIFEYYGDIHLYCPRVEADQPLGSICILES